MAELHNTKKQKTTTHIEIINKDITYTTLKTNDYFNNIAILEINIRKIDILPKKIRKLTIQYMVEELPKNMMEYTSLKTVYLYGCRCKIPRLPNSVEIMRISYMTSIKELDNYEYPNNLKYMYFGLNYDESISIQAMHFLMCKKIKYIILIDNIRIDVELPKSLRYIIYGNNYSQPINYITNSALKYIKLGWIFKENLPPLPPTMKRLDINSYELIKTGNMYHLEKIKICATIQGSNINRIYKKYYANNIFIKKNKYKENTFYDTWIKHIYIRRNLKPFIIYMLYNKIYMPYEIYNYMFYNFKFYISL